MKVFKASSLLLALASVWLPSCQLKDEPKPILAALPQDTGTVTMSKSEGFQDNYGSWELLGYQKGERVADFTLYSSGGQRFDFDEQLGKGKPLLLITGSYTCDITRANLPAIDSIRQQYGRQIDIYFVYTMEAHPSDQVSPYALDDKIWLMPNNIRDNVEAEQPRTYGQRVSLARFWQQRYAIQVPILMDSPDNRFWRMFGQAPNAAYLIEPDGEVYFKQIWLEGAELNRQLSKLIAQ